MQACLEILQEFFSRKLYLSNNAIIKKSLYKSFFLSFIKMKKISCEKRVQIFWRVKCQ